MAQIIIGRDKEQQELLDLYHSGRPEFVVVQGRRRVGKTYLVRELFDQRMRFYHTGLSSAEVPDQAEGLLRLQLASFYSSLVRYGFHGTVPQTWLEAFDQLRDLLESKANGERQVVFIDELPWMDIPRSFFIPALEHFWNGWASSQSDPMLIVCGSATSWINDKIINSKGGLYNRMTAEISLSPFTLAEREQLYQHLGVAMDRYDQLQAYMITGGIPYYMVLMEKKYSLAQNIDHLFFAKNAKLKQEFTRLFHSLFTNPDDYMTIVRLLGQRRIGYTRKEIAEEANMGTGGGLTTILKALEASCFIESYIPYKGSSRDLRYRLTDPFCLFYTHFLDKHKITDPHFWQNNQLLPSLTAWRGFAFENVCMLHIEQIKRTLGISGVYTECSSWKSKSSEPAAQIDLLIDRADRVLNICEMKFASNDFRIDKSCDADLRHKVATFIEETKCRNSIHLTLVTTFSLIHNEYAGRIQSVVTMDDLFQ